MTYKQYFLISLLAILFLNGCVKEEQSVPHSTEEYSSDAILSWIDLTLRLTKETPGFTPPVAARVYGYSGLALYESVRGGMPNFQSLQGSLPDFEVGSIPSINNDLDYHWGAVSNAAMALFLRNCFNSSSTNNLALINSNEELYENIYREEASSEIIDRSIAYGKHVGIAIRNYANSDGQELCYDKNFPSDYILPVGTGYWEPTSSDYPYPLQPKWGSVRPFMTQNIQDLLPVAPPAYSVNVNSQFYQEALEVYEVVQNLTPEQKVIAEFWSDDPGNTATPPGHSYSIMMQLIEDEGSNLAETAEMYAKLGMGVHDAFISCWNAKYHYNLVRPITYIHKYIDNTWSIPLETPPFPEYTSGHSVQSGATAQILTDLFGESYKFVDRTHVDRTDIDGSARTFNSFFEFADEAAISRLYGGIHYRTGIYVGLEQGINIGKNIATLPFEK